MSTVIDASSLGLESNKRMKKNDQAVTASAKSDDNIQMKSTIQANIISSYFPPNADYINQQHQSRSAGFVPNVLYDYIDHTERHKPFIFLETNNCVVIYDVYPKAFLHLLILPKRHFLNISTCGDLGPQYIAQVNEMHELARQISRTLTSTYNEQDEVKATSDDGEKRINTAKELVSEKFKAEDILIGYHTVPSLRPLHIHLITSDLCSPFLKNKLHWNSYTTPFFLPIDQVDEILQSNQTVKDVLPTKEGLEAHLKEPLKCNICGVALKNIPTLKTHQKTVHHFEYNE